MANITFGKWSIDPDDIDKLTPHCAPLDQEPTAYVDHENFVEHPINLYFSFEGIMYRICGNQLHKHKLVTTNALKKLQAITAPEVPERSFQPPQRPFNRSGGYGHQGQRRSDDEQQSWNRPRYPQQRQDNERPRSVTPFARRTDR
jgi:hypothetical protein